MLVSFTSGAGSMEPKDSFQGRICCIVGAAITRIPLHFIQTLNLWGIIGIHDSIPIANWLVL